LNNNKIEYKYKLKSKKKTEEIFNTGNVVYSSDKKLRAHYLLQSSHIDCGIRSSVAVSKKAGNAVWRNRAKRLIREANRLSNGELFDCCLNKKMQLEIIFAINSINQRANGNISLEDFQLPIEDILDRVKAELMGNPS
jgi:ribonuclease P protein component